MSGEKRPRRKRPFSRTSASADLRAPIPPLSIRRRFSGPCQVESRKSIAFIETRPKGGARRIRGRRGLQPSIQLEHRVAMTYDSKSRGRNANKTEAPGSDSRIG